MYCSTCGVAVAQHLSYCNHCGAKLNREAVTKSGELKPGLLIPAMVFLFVFGLVAITMLAGVMKTALGFNEGQILALTMLSFLIMIALEAVFITLLFRRPRHHDEGETVKFKDPATSQLDAARARSLPDAAPSVTEHTTRTFNPVYKSEK